MKSNSGAIRPSSHISSRRGRVVALVGGIGLLVGSLVIPGQAHAAEARVELGTAESFSVLAGSTVTNNGPSVLSASVGVSPGSALTGFPPGIVLGTTELANGVAGIAKADARTAFNDADGRALPAAVPNDLVGLTLLAGLHASPGPMSLSGEVTLDGGGDPNAVFIFQSPSTLITGSASTVTLTNGAQACNVVWQVDSSATLGTDTAFAGTILAAESITLTNGATLRGRAHALNGAVTLDTNALTSTSCATDPTSPSGSVPSGSVPSGSVPSGSAPSTTTVGGPLPTGPVETAVSGAPGTGPGAPTTAPDDGGGLPSAPNAGTDTTSGGSTAPSGGTSEGTTSLTAGGRSVDDGTGTGLRGGAGSGAARGAELSATGPGPLGPQIAVGVLLLMAGLVLSRPKRMRRH